MPRLAANGIHLEYETAGSREGTPLLMIHGLGAQLTRWPQELCDALVDRGFFIIRYDSRDIGLSTLLDDAPIPDPMAEMEARRRGEPVKLAYTLQDLAADAAGLLDALSIPQAHVLGVSLGGMVAQVLAIEHPTRVLSLNLMMTTSGNPELPPPDPETLAKLAAVAPNPKDDEEAYLQHMVALNLALGSPDYPTEEAVLRQFAQAAAKRAFYPAGTARQHAAVRNAPDRRHGLEQLAMPTLIIHGADDALVPLVAGEDIARHVKKGLLLVINGMGHDLPASLCETFASAIEMNAKRVTRTSC